LQDFGKAWICSWGQKGSHIIMQRKLETTTITVPVPNHSEIKTGTLLSIIRQSRVPGEEFET
jgi:predicted RNA binding protein YcfA (HicA-like mRNA interferase family)